MHIELDWFNDYAGYTGPALTDEMIESAEQELGFKLPDAYISLLRVKNGGRPRCNCYPMQVPTGWADDHIEIQAIFGIAGEWGIDGKYGSNYMIAEWGYPDVGVMIGMTPSAGHEAIMLDYSECGPQGDPTVIYVDVETPDGQPNIVTLAPDFEAFVKGLVSCDRYSV